jgi:hypothetical protein
MTRDDIIRMAREVGFIAYGEDVGEYRIPTPAFHNRLERFASLIAAAERAKLQFAAECFRMCEHKGVCHEKAKSNETGAGGVEKSNARKSHVR